MIAQMKAQGKYNPNWDDININLWDTSNKGIMTELSPLEWMNANQLSNVYLIILNLVPYKVYIKTELNIKDRELPMIP